MFDFPEELLPALTSRTAPLIVGHVTPDADCLSSMFALAQGIQKATGQTIWCALPGGSVSTRLRFLVEWAEPNIASAQQCRGARVLAVCDTAKLQRANLPDGLSRELRNGGKTINIDHHNSNTCFGDINWVDDQASSTCELIYRLYKETGWEVTPPIASLLYTGIHGDTIGFSLTTTSHHALAAAADLVKCGAAVGSIGEHLWRSLTQGEFDLRRIIYDNTRLSSTERIAFSTASHREITSTRCTAADIDDQVEIPRALDGVQIVLLFTEGNPGKVRVNLRGKANVDVLDLAKQIGGGGHRSAAGVIMDGSIEDAVASLLPLAEQYLDKLERTED